MDSFEINKIIAAVLLVALLVIGIGKVSNIILCRKPKTPGYAVEVEQVSGSITTTEVVEKVVDIAALMALGDVASGEKIFKNVQLAIQLIKVANIKLAQLYITLLEEKLESWDYKYSKALIAYEKEWTFEELNGFLIKPAKHIKGTKMAYAGLRKEVDRASVIKYLNANSDSPLPLP